MSFPKNAEPDWLYLASLEKRIQSLEFPSKEVHDMFIKNAEQDFNYLASLEARVQTLELPKVEFALPVEGASWAYDFTDARSLAVVNGRIAYAEDISGSNRPFRSSTRDCRPRYSNLGSFSFAEFLGATHDTGLVSPLAERVEVDSFSFVMAWRSPVAAQQPLISNFAVPPTPLGNGSAIYFGKNSSGGPTLFTVQPSEAVNTYGATVGSYGSGWIVASWVQSATFSRSLYVDTTPTVLLTPQTQFRATLDLLQLCREGTIASDFDVAFMCCFPRTLSSLELAAMQRHAASLVGRSL